MSRSYRKFAVSKDRERRIKHRLRQKTFANRKVRRYKGIPGKQGGYRKLYCSWFLCDWRWVPGQNEKEAIRRELTSLHPDYTEDETDKIVNEWKKFYKRK
ncbi:MAG: hypothetical protein II936_11180 [Oscillospiraceae bacterium]|nr:hypothetical protein [Oscillospiraceae bacterium]